MTRRQKGEKVDGWVVLDKPAGLSSAQAVAAVRRLLGARKAGHAGTLDPLATGVLPIGLGEATKAMPFLVEAAKEYEFGLRWGETRDTGDAEGAVIASSERTPTRAAILAAIPRFLGEIEQVPPAHSAVKVGGARAYALARAGEAPELSPRRVRIDALALLDHDEEARASRFRLACGKGTYVRALARDLAQALGCCGHVSMLRRTRVGPFRIEDSISLEMLRELGHGARASRWVQPVATALADIPALAVTEREGVRLRQGQSLRISAAREGRQRVMCGDRLIAIASGAQGIVRPLRVFDL